MSRLLLVPVLVLSLAGCSSPDTPAASTHAQAQALTDEPADFGQWLARYQAADASSRAGLEPLGQRLAEQRRATFRQLLLSDPEQALATALTPVQRAALPPSIASAVEQWRDGVGTVHVISGTVDGENPTPLLERFVTFEGVADEVLRAGVFGQRLGDPTREKTRLHGVVLDGAIAVSDHRLRQLFPGEPRPPLRAEWPRACPVSKRDIESDLVFNGGDTLYGFCTAEHAQQFDKTLSLAELEEAAAEGLPPSSAWATGNKSVLYIRVDFADHAGDPVSAASAQAMIDTTVTQFYDVNSYGQTSLTATVTPTLRLPKTQAEYRTNEQYLLLRSDALAAARDAGFESNDFDRDVVAFASTYSGWAGRAYVGSKGVWLNGYFDLRVTGHELGHNYGVNHANYWNATGLTIIGPGSNTEYGNPFDIMGTTGSQNHQFTAWFKKLVGWLPDSEISTVTSSGTVRLAELEKPLVAGKHAAKIPRGDGTHDYWLEYRPKYNTSWTRDGLSINWGYAYNTGAHLLDLTPGDGSRTNSTLIIGRTFSDPLRGIHITPVAKAGTTPEALDVVVNLGTFPGNHPPTLSLSASTTTAAVNQVVTFTATASDADGDPLAYAWDFGDDTWGPNAATVTRAFTAERSYSVRLTVSDMKGGTVSRAVVITVGTPTTFTLSGTVREGANPLEGVRISDGTRVTFTSADGTWALAAVPAGDVTVSAAKVDYSFTRSFAAPLTVAASQGSLDFAATLANTHALKGKVSQGTTGISGVTVTDGTHTATTNGSGDYTLSGVPSGLVTLSASKPGWAFSPSGFTNPVEVYGGDVTALNFIAAGVFLSGTIPSAGVGTAPIVTDGVRTATATGGSGTWYWNLSGVPNGDWNVVATSPGVTLTPLFSNPVQLAGQGRSNLNFSVTAGATYLVQGTVKTGATPLPGVVISDGTRSATTDSLGRYTIVGVPPGTYTLTPTHGADTFTPATLSVTVSAANLTGKDFATTAVNLPPTLVTAASATPSPVTGTTTQLSVLGSDDTGESSLTYTWTSSAYAPVSFSSNGSNAAKHASVSFTSSGTYTLECRISDPGGLSIRSSVVVQVQGQPMSMAITPANVTIAPSATQTFQAAMKDQFNNNLYTGTPLWSLAGAGTLTGTGILGTYVAPATPGGPYVITATNQGFTATAQVTIAGVGSPSLTTPPHATPSPVTGTTTQLSVRATDDGGESALTYRWIAVTMPAAVTFSDNATNAAKDTTVTFTAAGPYTFVVEVTDAQGHSTSGTVDVQVIATPARLEVLPVTATVQVAQSLAFTASAEDQFGAAMAPAPVFTWSVSGGGTVEPSGLFTADATPGGPFTLTARAGSVEQTATVTVIAAPDVTAPVVQLLAPVEGAQLEGTASLLANATDDVGVTQLEFLADGTTTLATLAAAPWQASFDVSTLSAGAHVLSVRATDAAGNVGVSDGVTVTVGVVAVDHQAPVVSVVTPGEGAKTGLSVAVTVDATDDVGVTQVDLELDGNVATSLAVAPWSSTLTVTAGAHELVAIARDASGKVTRSAVVHFEAAESSTSVVTTPEPPAQVVGSCGCSSVGPAAWVLVVAALRRRRKGR